MSGRNWFHMWMRLADALAMRVCVFVEASDSGDDLRAPFEATRRSLECAQRAARLRRRAIRRADEALARYSALRVDGGAK